VHGYLAGAEIWRYQASRLSSSFEVLVPSLPGFGESAHLDAPYTIEGFATALLHDLREFGIKFFHLVGHSMGGMIVQTMASLAPSSIAHLVCYGTGPVGVMPDRFETNSNSRKRLKQEGLNATAKRIAATWFMDGEDAKDFDLCERLGQQASIQAADIALQAMENWDGRAKMSEIEAKTLVLWGDHDKSYAWAQPEALWRGIADSSLAVIPNCAHNVHLEKPEMFTNILEDFLPKRPDRDFETGQQ